jgi:spore coat protein A
MRKLTRREFAQLSALGAGALMLPLDLRRLWAQAIEEQTLDPTLITKWDLPLIKPPALGGTLSGGGTRTRRRRRSGGGGPQKMVYDIAVRQFDQQILSSDYGPTTVWSYGSSRHDETFNYPAFTVENKFGVPTEVTWRNELVDSRNRFLPHLLPVDQTLHWANPPGPRDRRGHSLEPYQGPVPLVTHVHGAHVKQDYDGYPEAWYLPNARNIPRGYFETGTFFDYFNELNGSGWGPGFATFEYPNDQPATTLWYHDHTLGMTRLNVYAGPAGFWLIRGGPNDADLGYVAPGVGDDPFGEYTEIPIVIQDRSFKPNPDGNGRVQLFYPDTRAFFEGLAPEELDIPFWEEEACSVAGTDGLSDIAPIWNPEFFGNAMVVNGRTWPYLDVEPRRYRFRFLNGCNSRFLDLKMTTSPRGDNAAFNSPEHNFVQIGADQGFLPAPQSLNHLLMAPAERADVVVDFSAFAGQTLYLVNDGPDAPFGGISLEDLSNYATTGQVMQFRVASSTSGSDTTEDPMTLTLPAATVPAATTSRNVSLHEEESETVFVSEVGGIVGLDCAAGEAFAPKAALLGIGTTADPTNRRIWMDPITENPALGATEEWVIHNFTEDAHPIHVHQVKFQVLGRGPDGNQAPEAWETGPKDTVIAYPGEKTRIKMHFDLPGYYVWHCHIVEHEDNEMMRPMHVGPIPADGPQP